MKRPDVHPKLREALIVDGPWGNRPAPARRAPDRRFAVLTVLAAVGTFVGVFALETDTGGSGAPGAVPDRIAADRGDVAPSRTPVVRGRAVVIDGDTVEIAGERIRLNGIDAPESAQLCQDQQGKSYRCGAEAARALDKLLAASRPTECRFIERDQYGRFVGDCHRADGQSVAVLLVSSGQALDWPRHSNGAYAGEQRSAQAQKLGVWRGNFREPWLWRAEQRERANQVTQRPVGLLSSRRASNAGCDIKGNISSKGERIYHVPGQEYYERTRISAGKGERWFCSEGEARAAGWRRSKR